ncbi:MAG: CheR family methyltransferase, partial [Myxococcota bacterium]
MHTTSTLKFARAADTSAFSEFRIFIRAQFGIDLPENKETFVTSRMRKIVEGQGYSDFNAFMRAFLAHPNPEQLSLILDQISTNHTFFFREPSHFMCLRQLVLPECRTIVDQDRLKQLRVWSAACSTGEEPYSIMMTLKDELGPEYMRYSPQLLATDINSEVLDSARRGTFPKKNTVLVPAELRTKYLTESGDRDVAHDYLKRDITFRRFNLMTPH